MENIRLSETDLIFLLDAIGAESEEKVRLKQLVRKDEALLNAIIGDEKVFSKVIGDEESFLRISPQLYFEVLLRRPTGNSKRQATQSREAAEKWFQSST